MTDHKSPVTVTGGCNCGSIRYTITFPTDTQWPPESNGTCQCTLCRKFTGSLLPQSISVPTASIIPPLQDSSTYKQWDSTKGGLRGFCSTCGCSMTFSYIAQPQRTEIYLGTIDEEMLLGEKSGDEYHGEYGTRCTRKSGGLGALLTKTERSGHIWFENAIEGVTDWMPGLKFWRERTDGIGFERESEVHQGSPRLEKKTPL